MSGERATYVDSSAILKLVVAEPESLALLRYLRRREPLVASALVRAEVARGLLSRGRAARRRGEDVIARVELVRISERILRDAGSLPPFELRTLDAIHLATARALGEGLARVVTYDRRMASAAAALGLPVAAPA